MVKKDLNAHLQIWLLVVFHGQESKHFGIQIIGCCFDDQYGCQLVIKEYNHCSYTDDSSYSGSLVDISINFPKEVKLFKLHRYQHLFQFMNKVTITQKGLNILNSLQESQKTNKNMIISFNHRENKTMPNFFNLFRSLKFGKTFPCFREQKKNLKSERLKKLHLTFQQKFQQQKMKISILQLTEQKCKELQDNRFAIYDKNSDPFWIKWQSSNKIIDRHKIGQDIHRIRLQQHLKSSRHLKYIKIWGKHKHLN